MLIIYSILITILSVNYQMMLESNRIYHFIMSLLLTFFLKKVDNGLTATVLIVFSIGIAKELTDPVFDWYDLLANCIGILVGVIL